MRTVSQCPACARAPLGAEGHLDLFVLKMQGNRMQFICRTCSSLWLRTTVDGSYRWSESAREIEAPAVPGSTEIVRQSRS